MHLERVARRSLGDQVFDQLTAQIVHGELVPGESLPAERALVELLGVNRQAVREAIKRLEETGLVDVVHGGGTTVTDWRRRAGLGLLPKLVLAADGSIEQSVVRSVMEFRATIGPEVAARCADRVVPSTKAALAAVAGRYRAVGPDTTIDDFGRLDTDLWDALVEGADNIAFRLAYNAMRNESAAVEGLLRLLLAEEMQAVALRLRLVEAATAGDATRTRAAASTLLAMGTAAVAEAMSLPHTDPTEPAPAGDKDKERPQWLIARH